MADIPTWGALVFGGVGSFAAARSLRIQANEHKRLTQELAKRADFAISIRPMLHGDVGSDSATIDVTPETSLDLPFAIGIKNTGDRAATHVTINFLAPDRHWTVTWIAPNGEPEPDKPKAATTSETLVDEDWASTRFLTWEFDRVAVRTPRMVHAAVTTDLPPMNGSTLFPVRVRVQSDDLPDDVPERVKDYVVRLRHRR